MVGRAVLRAPYEGARALLMWAVDMWPYVNGKALMSGIRLGELEASDMLDVVHFLFEDDMAAASGEQAEARSHVRTTLYRNFYEREYKYKIDSSSNRSGGSSHSGSTYADGSPINGFDDDLEPFDPMQESKPVKPYVPATDFNPDAALPFGKDLDAPLG